MEHGRLEMIVSLLLGFSCLLRTGELLQLKVSDFCISAVSGICSLKETVTKSGRRDASNESVSFTDIPTVEAVKQLLFLRKSTNTGLYLWPHSGAFFRLPLWFRCSPISTLFFKKGWRYPYFSMQWFYGIGNVERQMAI